MTIITLNTIKDFNSVSVGAKFVASKCGMLNRVISEINHAERWFRLEDQRPTDTFRYTFAYHAGKDLQIKLPGPLSFKQILTDSFNG